MPSPSEAVPVSDWMEADYFRRPRRLRRVRQVLGWAVLLAALIAIALTIWPGRPTIYQAGRLSAAHAMFNDQCNVCHADAFRTTMRLWPGNAKLPSVPDQACVSCHSGAIHNEQEIDRPSCGSCHREHQGRMQLARVADTHCTSCHADLHRMDGAPPAYANVSDFGKNHPEFAFWRSPQPTDPGKLHFNHQLHLQTNGIPGTNGQSVTLNCQSCHQPDADRRYMKPVTYAQHCASCHPLSVQLAGSWSTPAAQQVAEAFRKQPAPHKAPVEVRAEMRERLLEMAERVPALREDTNSTPDRLLPGHRLPPAQKLDAAAWAQQQLQVSERILFQGAAGCAFCHMRKPLEKATFAATLPTYEPTKQLQRWLTHGAFNHDSHRMLTCAECHPAAESREAANVLIPKIASCQKCHNAQVGARSDCSNCHRYHDRSRENDWQGHFTIEEALGRTPQHP